MIIEDSNFVYMALPTDVFDNFRTALVQAIVSLKRDEFQSDDRKIRRAEYVLANILNDSMEAGQVPASSEQTLRWFFDLDDQEDTPTPEEETSEES